VSCEADEKCEGGACVELTCADLTCKDTETCIDPAEGGAFCEPLCKTDLDCPSSEFCNGTICEADTCKPGDTKCEGDDLLQCAANGSAFGKALSCGSSTLSGAACTDNGDGKAFCPCFDDWDCPAFTVCEAGSCQGTGKAPTCALPPVPFAEALPKKEIQWGGTGQGANNPAVGSPFPTSSQVSATPIVANLDDDNGDGKIDERDFPEIVFMTYCGTDISTNGIVRAIHGGGPNKGKDFFATCGNTLWSEGEALNKTCACADATGNSTAALAVGDLDGDGIPEIVVPNENAGLTILDNKGKLITQSPNTQWSGFPNPAVTIANLDNAGLSELIVGNVAFTLGKDASGKLIFVDRFVGTATTTGKNGQGPVSCVANIAGDARPEIIAGTGAFRLPVPPAGVTARAQCAANDPTNFCKGTLDVVWDGQTVNGAVKIPNAQRDGFCAVADVLGADTTAAPGPSNPLDGKPEVVLVSNGFLQVLEGETGKQLRFINLNVGLSGGAPNIDDFDGDGFPEIGTAFGLRYLMIDLQDPTPGTCPAWTNAFNDAQQGLQNNPARNPGGACSTDAECAQGAVCNKTVGACVCLHNGWQRITEDDSSRVTGSSVFDFNGDGAAEVVYGDECFLRIYDGVDGQVLFKTNAPSRTRIENPVIADVDNDGNAEIVHATNNDASACSVGGNFPNGIQVLGDASDAWVSARRIWNQHAYHITNVSESSQIPVSEPDSWKSYNGRTYNTYRSNPRSFGVAPDLTIGAVQVASPDVTCGQLSSKLLISAVIENKGDLRVGSEIVATFYGEWTNLGLKEPLYADAAKTPLAANLPGTLEPGGSVILTVPYDAANNSPNSLPDQVRIVIDEANTARECIENNNEKTVPVAPGELTADLELSLGLVGQINCPSAVVPTTVTNLGSADASGVIVRYYAGDPDQGGSPIHDELFAGPFAAGGGTETRNVSITTLPPLSVQIFARVDPENAIPECKDSNNTATVDTKIDCTKF
jgi:hypothetical protein